MCNDLTFILKFRFKMTFCSNNVIVVKISLCHKNCFVHIKKIIFRQIKHNIILTQICFSSFSSYYQKILMKILYNFFFFSFLFITSLFDSLCSYENFFPDFQFFEEKKTFIIKILLKRTSSPIKIVKKTQKFRLQFQLSHLFVCLFWRKIFLHVIPTKKLLNQFENFSIKKVSKYFFWHFYQVSQRSISSSSFTSKRQTFLMLLSFSKSRSKDSFSSLDFMRTNKRKFRRHTNYYLQIHLLSVRRKCVCEEVRVRACDLCVLVWVREGAFTPPIHWMGTRLNTKRERKRERER